MNTKIKNIIYLLPPIIVDLFRLLRQFISSISQRRLVNNNRIWENIHFGKTVYIIGNGPSILNIDFNALRSKNIIVMNNFHLAKWQMDFKPIAHCIGEPPNSSAWVDPSFSINMTNADSYWLHIESIHHIKEARHEKKVHYVIPGFEPKLWRNRKIKLHGLTLGYQTTAILAIQVALYMGFKDIRLLGFDHDWLAKPDYSRHFYSSERDDEDKLHTFTYLDIIRMVERMWDGYYALKRASFKHGAKITNMTTGSFLDVFDNEIFT